MRPPTPKMILLSKNKKAFFDYEIVERYEAGVVLTGPEVKSIRGSRVQLKGSYVQIINKRPVVVNMHVSEYKAAPSASYDPTHTRMLLLKKKEIVDLEDKLHQKGLTVIPLELYLKDNFIKMLIGVCRGRKQFDKRELLKERTIKREIDKKMKFR